MNYSKFSVEDLAADDYFIRWVSQNDQEAEKFWTLFISLHPEMKPKIDQARTLVLSLAHDADNVAEADQKLEVIWAGIQNRIKHAGATDRPKQLHYNFILGIAASLVAIAILLAGVYLSSDGLSIMSRNLVEFTHATKDFSEKVNSSEKPIRISLSDGTVVRLGKNSRLVYKDD